VFPNNDTNNLINIIPKKAPFIIAKGAIKTKEGLE
jgi:hypothetical protein